MAKSELIYNRLNQVNKKSINIRIFLCIINRFWIRKTRIKLVRDLWNSFLFLSTIQCNKYRNGWVPMPKGISELVHVLFCSEFSGHSNQFIFGSLGYRGKSVFIDNKNFNFGRLFRFAFAASYSCVSLMLIGNRHVKNAAKATSQVNFLTFH